jgi:hypothetical protein
MVGFEFFDERAKAHLLARDIGSAALVGVEVRVGHLLVQFAEFFAERGYVGNCVHR